ncbi:hypothetical protein WG902_04050 [Ramlibacter sp. PS3R-8]|uniref:hypothetical protein n=1 Tax=Ramlibacter sp. PS3R-8 TaxID=3133437 RepID=UPI0030B74ACF
MRLQPAGRRWGFGAHSVVPYLAHTPAPHAKPGESGGAIRNPVFPHMDSGLPAMRRSH